MIYLKKAFKHFLLLSFVLIIGCEDESSMKKSTENSKSQVMTIKEIQNLEGNWCLTLDNMESLLFHLLNDEIKMPIYEFRKGHIYLKLENDIIGKGNIMSKESQLFLLSEDTRKKISFIKKDNDKLKIVFEDKSNSVHLIKCQE